MPQGGKGKSPLALGGGVPEEVGRVGVAQLVKDQAEHQNGKGQKKGQGIPLQKGDHSPMTRYSVAKKPASPWTTAPVTPV